MSDVLDPQLRFLQEAKKRQLSELAETSRFGVAMEGTAARANVLVRTDGPPEALEAVGLEVGSVAGDVVSGVIDVDKLAALADADGVVAVEGSRPMARELDLSVPESRANVVHAGPPGHRGAGVIVGIVDSGIDWRHENFRRPDGTSRILFIWDQFLTPQAGEVSPAGFGIGVEYSRAQIDAALQGVGVVRHDDAAAAQGHGTHVAGIAAGDGSAAGQSRPGGTFVGVAPEADIIVVANQGGGARGLGDSARTLDAVSYIFQKAAALNRPVVINQSQGDNLGPHDGTSLLERGLDNLLGGPGRAMVKSAGNAAADRIHAQGTVGTGAPQIVQFGVVPQDTTPETMDIWYEGSDRFDFRITEPGGPTSATVSPGSSATLTLGNGNSVFVDSRVNDPNNGDNRIFLTIARGTAPTLEAGTWSFTLVGTTVVSGRFDAWIQRGQAIAAFVGAHQNPDNTISTPGSAVKMITAGSYITRGAGVPGISAFSSRGPTRDGRPAPDVAAPGQFIISAAASVLGTGDAYQLLQGTSMAAPHVTGAVALMLQADPALNQLQIKDCLRRTARADAFTGAVPNTVWGAGKLDVAAAFACSSPGPTVPVLSLVTPCVPQTLRPPCVLLTRDPGCVPITREPACRVTLDPACRITRNPTCRITLRPPCRITVNPVCAPLTRDTPCVRITRTPDCVLPTRDPGCVVTTRDPGCLRPTLACPQTAGPACGPDPVVDPGTVINPGTIGRTIIGRENPETGRFSWIALDPYGQVEAVAAEGDEAWSDVGEDDMPMGQ